MGRFSSRWGRAWAWGLSVACAGAAPGQVYLVKDINAVPGGVTNSAPAGPFAALNGRMLFFTRFGLHSTDGTPEGTALVKAGVSNVAANAAGTSGMVVQALANRVLFTGQGGQVWVTDGTEAGTTPVMTQGGLPLILRGTGFGLRTSDSAGLYGSTSTSGPVNLWQTDGTMAGTMAIVSTFLPAGWTAVGTPVGGYVIASHPTSGWALFGVDVWTGLTTQLRMLAPAAQTQAPEMMWSGQYVFFTGNNLADTTVDPGINYVWATSSFAQFSPTFVWAVSPQQSGQYLHLLRASGNQVTVARSGTGLTSTVERSLWVGYANIQMATQLATFGTSAAVGGSAEGPYVSGISRIYTGWTHEICRADMFTENTQRATLANDPAQIVTVNGECWFSDAGAAGTGGAGAKWFRWRQSDATPQELVTIPSVGTTATAISTGVGGAVAALGGRVLFNATYGTTGTELWTTDGTSAGTVQLEDLGHATGDSSLGWFTKWNGKAFFTTGGAGALWVTDGTNAGTRQIKPGSFSLSVTKLVATPSCVLVHSGSQLWRTDGTNAGTFVVGPAPISGFFNSYIERHNGFAVTPSGVTYFAATSTDGNQVWRTDGTVAGTYAVTTRAAGFTAFGSFGEFGAMGNSSAVFVVDSAGGRKLWRTDGTAGGTAIVGLSASANISVLEKATAMGDLCLFVDLNTSRLMRTDGTVAGTFALTAGNATHLLLPAVVGNRMFFTDTTSTPAVARVTDGTVAGTVVIPGVTPTAVGRAGNFGLFNSTAGVYAADGLGGPAVLLSATAAQPRDRTFLDGPEGTYYFGTDGWVWKTDGTVGGTMRAGQLAGPGGEAMTLPFASSTSPNNDAWYEFDAAMAGSRLVFVAKTPSVGVELWGVDVRASGDCNANGVADSIEIDTGAAWDANRNGVIDSCECLANWNGGAVSVQDIFDFINDWFAVSGDFNHSGATDVADIFDFLNAWLAGCG